MTWDGVEKRKAVEHYAQQLEWARDKKDAERFRALQDMHKMMAQAFFWNYDSRKQRAAAIDAYIAKEHAR